MSLAEPAPSRPDSSILVTTFRRPRHLALVLESIAMQRGVPRDFEVVVADDGSGDATAEVVERFAATVDIPVRFTTQQHEASAWRGSATTPPAWREATTSCFSTATASCPATIWRPTGPAAARVSPSWATAPGCPRRRAGCWCRTTSRS
jgi:glycosyltransferase involved in cell wall biosynthesis